MWISHYQAKWFVGGERASKVGLETIKNFSKNLCFSRIFVIFLRNRKRCSFSMICKLWLWFIACSKERLILHRSHIFLLKLYCVGRRLRKNKIFIKRTITHDWVVINTRVIPFWIAYRISSSHIESFIHEKVVRLC